MKQLVMKNRFKLLSLDDQWWVALATGVFLLLVGSAVVFWSRPSMSPLRWILQAALVISYILFILQRKLSLNRRCRDGRLSASLGAANWITLARGGLIAMLAGFWLQPWPGRFNSAEEAGWLPGIIFITATLGDVFDGWVARQTDNQTFLGEYLDTRIDALGILVASFVAVDLGQLPEFYISAGLAWYLLKLAVWLRKRTGRWCGEVKRRGGARFLAGLQMAFLGLVLLPLLSPLFTHVAAPLILVPFLAGFLLDWQVVCRHENSN
jgi:CDP-diacylglycerol--glycerol-3-phosphate 3-phosphatidyltransferase